MKGQHGKLIVKNFGPIEMAEVDLKQLMILIGPQGAGKSTLLKIINGLEKYARIVGKQSQTSRNDFVHLAFFDLGIADMISSTTEIEYTTSRFKIVLRNKAATLYKPNGQNIWNLKELIFIPAERAFFATINENIYYFLDPEIKIPEILRRFGIEWTEARKNITQLKIDFLDVLYFQIDGRDQVLFDEKRGKSVLIEKSASGFQSAIPMSIVIENIGRLSPPLMPLIGTDPIFFNESVDMPIRIVFIEEPELNLFPDTQKKLVEFMASKLIHYHEKPHSLFIATHSPYILTAFDNLIQAGNAFKKNSELEKQINKIIPRESWIDFDEVSAYYIEKGKTTSILNKKNRSIAANKIDKVSEEISIQFDKLLDLTYQKI